LSYNFRVHMKTHTWLKTLLVIAATVIGILLWGKLTGFLMVR
jgi:hypothetical protein